MSLPDIPIAGVGLILIHNAEEAKPQVLILTELETKPWLGKHAGMQSFPMETTEGEETPDQTIERLIRQELPGIRQDIIVDHEPAGVYQVIEQVWLLVWCAQSLKGKLPENGSAEVIEHRWFSLREAAEISNLRQGAREPLIDCLKGNFLKTKRPVVCDFCEPSYTP